jgi:hypothetical protein
MNKTNASLVSNRIPRNDAMDVIGAYQYGDAWVPELTPDEWELVQRFKGRFVDTTIAVPVELRDKLYEAEERAARSDRQNGEVINWLENHGFDCIRGKKEGFDRKRFEKIVARAFGGSSPPGRKAGSSSPKSQMCLEALKILEVGSILPGRGRMAKIICAIHPKFPSYKPNSIERMIRSSVREWEMKNPGK